jgi:predicted ester cyclase
MSTESKDLIRRWFEEVWNKGREDAIDEMFAADGVAHGLTEEGDKTMRGPEQFKPFYRVEDTIAEGDKLAARCTVRGKHQSDSLGFAATGLTTDFTGITIVRIERGKIVEAWNNFDFMTMYKQLGAL